MEVECSTNSEFYTFTDWYDDNRKFIVARDTNYCPNIQSISVLLSNQISFI